VLAQCFVSTLRWLRDGSDEHEIDLQAASVVIAETVLTWRQSMTRKR